MIRCGLYKLGLSRNKDEDFNKFGTSHFYKHANEWEGSHFDCDITAHFVEEKWYRQ